MFSITANDEFFPQGVGIDPQGHVFVSDFANNRILKFSNTGHFIREWGTSGSDNGQFNNPFQVAVDSQGNVFIADSFNNRIQKFSNTGTFIAKWGTEGSGDGQFIEPFGVAVDPQGHVFVSDASNHRIQKFSNTGSFIRTWNSTSSSSRESFVLFPDSGFAGNIVTITGTGFAPNIPVAIKFDAVLVATDPATVTTDNNGEFTARINVPGVDIGPHTISANFASKLFTVLPINEAPGISISPTSGPVGTSVDIAGNTFAPTSTITIEFDGTPVATSPGTVTSNSAGSFTATFNVPPSSNGEHTVVATQGSNSAGKTFTVTSNTLATSQSSSLNLSEKMIVPDIFS